MPRQQEKIKKLSKADKNKLTNRDGCYIIDPLSAVVAELADAQD